MGFTTEMTAVAPRSIVPERDEGTDVAGVVDFSTRRDRQVHACAESRATTEPDAAIGPETVSHGADENPCTASRTRKNRQGVDWAQGGCSRGVIGT